MRKKKREAQRLAPHIGDPDHWAKPFYADVTVFQRGVERCFVGLNPAGNCYSKRIDMDDRNDEKIWSGKSPFHNSYLDERWGKTPGDLSMPGSALLQVRVQEVFKALYGSNWEDELRVTACFNLAPVSSKDWSRLPAKIKSDCINWGIDLIRHLKPKLIITMGAVPRNELTKNRWDTELKEITRRRDEDGRTMATVELGTLNHGFNSGARLLALPHLSQFYDKKNLIAVLNKIKSEI